MRLLHTHRLEFEEFFDDQVPNYSILSHRWGKLEQEVSYADFKLRKKTSTSGYAKIVKLCELTEQHGMEYCWVDTCCIDKSSSAELSEAINSMFAYYQRAKVCFAYLEDVAEVSQIAESKWFSRGWTLQELIAPAAVVFLNTEWQTIGTKLEHKQPIAQISGIDEALLAGKTNPKSYSIAQIMSWAAGRSTSRLEDEAYSLLGLLGVNMPLLYGEGSGAFRRLQEEVLAKGEDTSLFAWGDTAHGDLSLCRHASILAPSPHEFHGCGDVIKGFSTHRIQFEVTNRGMMVLIHRSYDRNTVGKLLKYVFGTKDGASPFSAPQLGLTIPLGCYRRIDKPRVPGEGIEPFFLQLVLDGGKWRRVGVTQQFDRSSQVLYRGPHYSVYTNDYVRIYIHHDRNIHYAQRTVPAGLGNSSAPRHTLYLHLRDALDYDVA